MTDWPTLPNGATDAEKKVFEAKVELSKAIRQDELDLDEETSKALYTGLLGLATGSVDRSRKSAELVQGAAVAVAGLYTGILGLIFVAKDNPMPWRGIWATFFFAAAVVLAMSYVAFLTRSRGVAPLRPPAQDNAQRRLFRRAIFFTEVTRTMVHERAPLLRASVVSLAFGVLLLPAVFLEFDALASSSEGTAASSSATSGAVEPAESPAPSPTPIVWPTPAMTDPPGLAAILYRAQLEVHMAELAEDPPKAADDDLWENMVTAAFALGGAYLVYRVARNRWPLEVT